MIAAAVYVPLLDGRPVAEPGAADGAAGAALADVVADLAALHGTIEQIGALPPLTASLECARAACAGHQRIVEKPSLWGAAFGHSDLY